MNHSAKKQLHEKARKQRKQEMQAHAREAARRGQSSLPLVFLVAGILVIAVAVAALSLR
jgi:hypothetical protein